MTGVRARLLALILGIAAAAGGAAAAEPEAEPFAVVELFTSQGCSSCPGAEAVLRDLSAHARKSGLRVFPIEWHVDYWDRLGWPDPFGDPDYTRRQRRYARALGSRTIYTPQIIVNGATVVRPAQRRQIVFDAVEAALAEQAQAAVSLAAVLEDGSLRVTYEVDDAPRRAAMLLVVVERGLGNHVPRGENAGRTLRHDEVARALHDLGRIDRQASGAVELALPAGVDPAQASVIAIVHDAVTQEIVGAAGVDLA